MSFYEDLVMQTQMNFQKYYGIYRRGGTPYELAGPSKLSMDEKIDRLVQEIREDRKSTRLNSSHKTESRMPSSA